MKFDYNLKFVVILCNAKALKSEYEGLLTSFSYFERKKRIEFMRKTRNNLYALKFEDWKKGKIWDYFNGYITYKELIEIFEKMY